MTMFGDMVMQYGGVPVSTNNFAGFWGSNVYFVDGDNGSDGNNGKKPTKAFATIAQAISTATAGDTIYIKPRVPKTDASDQEVYEENQTIPYAKHSLSIIGATTASTVYGPKVRNSAAGYVFDVYAPNTRIENLSVHRFNSNSGTGGIYLRGTDYASSAGSVGSMISNCHIRYASDGVGAGVYVYNGYFSVIQNCTFTNCDTNIYLRGTGASRGHQVIGCNFMSHSGTAEGTDAMVLIAGPQTELLIKDCHFDQATLFIDCSGSVDGLVSNCYFQDGAITPSNGGTAIDTGEGSLDIVGCYDQDGIVQEA